ncbi:MAG: NAD-dependent epimerase/dehydratase family protein [Candidatus Abyssobacteria bacterium SURF_5]|uniref:NAD-dependent epimerase/dehydratase family protein n=1 Tax=Abyssobacteria bacterium (strain SURF_5) TaxID=2093360 RepID=A0A3A4N7L1_ABYX5|nr:MAG: NAD-dependent epimerase/dehydratase family protein [Candidatus Abyssubacteria bacterium SURF_5]
MTKDNSRPRRAPDIAGRCVLMTGTSGFVGGNLLKRLRQDHHYKRIVEVDVARPSTKSTKEKFYKVDLTHPRADEMIYEIIEGEKPDTVIHAGFHQRPISDTTYAHEVTSIGTMHVLSACAEAAIRKIVVASRTLVYGARYDNPHYMDENYTPRPRLDYEFQLDLVEVERQLLRFWKANPNTLVTVLRHSSIIGPTVDNCWTHYLSMPVCPTVLGYNPLIQFISEDDVIDAFKLAVDEDFHGVFNIVGQRIIPLSMILKLANKKSVPMPYPLAQNFIRALWIAKTGPFPPEHLDFLRYHCLADGSRAKEVMGFEAKKTAWQALEEFLEVKRLGRVGRRPATAEDDSDGEALADIPAAEMAETLLPK